MDVSKYMKTHFYQAFTEASAQASDVTESDEASVIGALKTALAAVDQDMLAGPLSKKLHYQGATSCMVYLYKPISGHECSAVISANVGDSRAILARGGQAIDLTEDHKPNLPSEKKRGESKGEGGFIALMVVSHTLIASYVQLSVVVRLCDVLLFDPSRSAVCVCCVFCAVESLGGVVSWHGRRDKAGRPIESTGVYRVNRNLALSRSMGDRYMRPYVTSEPDFVHMSLVTDDEFIVGE